MTDATIKNLITQKVVSAGMTRRCLFVTGKSSGASVPFPEVTPEQEQAMQRCLAHALELRSVSGEFVWTDEARKVYTDWYHTNTTRRDAETNDILQQFLQTKPELVIKIAMLHAIAEPSPTLVLTASAICLAINEITLIEAGGPSLFEGSGRNPLSPTSSEIERVIKLSEIPVHKKKIYLQFRKDASIPEIDMLLDSLRRVDQIFLLKGPVVNGMPVEYYASKEVAKKYKDNPEGKIL